MYKYDLHVHNFNHRTGEQLKPEVLIPAYIKQGYKGIVLTNHYDSCRLQRYCNKPLYYRNAQWISSYCNFKNMARVYYKDFDVLLGMEYTLEVGSRERHILVYGNEIGQHIHTGKLKPYLNLEELRSLFTKSLLIEAHPYRGGNKPLDMRDKLIDGYEIYNAKGMRSSENEQIQDYITKLNVGAVFTAGSDLHSIESVATATGILVSEPIINTTKLVESIKGAQLLNCTLV